MTDLKTQLRTYYETTTVPVDIDNIVVDPGTVLVGPVPEAARRRSAMTTEQSTTSRSWFQGSRAAVVALVATVAVIAVIVLATNDSGSDVATDRSPGAVLFAFQDAYNAGDLGEVLDQFADDATMSRFPGPLTNAANIDEIEAIFEQTVAEGQYEMTEVEVDGPAVTFRHRWTSEEGGCRTAPGHRIVVENGLIQSWDWPTTMAVC